MSKVTPHERLGGTYKSTVLLRIAENKSPAI